MNIQLYEKVPSKSEITKAINAIPVNSAIETYVQFKVMEEIALQGISKFKQPAIESFLKAQEGLTKGQVLGCDIKIVGEAKTVTRKRYVYSEKIKEQEEHVEKTKLLLKIAEDSLKLMQQLEINQGIAIEEIFSEIEPEKLSLRVTLTK
jgi:hypothetical protein